MGMIQCFDGQNLPEVPVLGCLCLVTVQNILTYTPSESREVYFKLLLYENAFFLHSSVVFVRFAFLVS